MRRAPQRPIHIACVAGARPNFIKIASLLDEIRKRREFRCTLIHTGQHFSPEMSRTFFDELEIPRPDVNLAVSGGAHVERTAEIARRLEAIFQVERPDVALVVGDVDSTLAGALAAAQTGIRLAHVEAGLRSFDRRMPEEINRVVTDRLSDFLFTTEPSANRNLAAEGVPAKRVFYTGNVMIDTLLRFRSKAAGSQALERLGVQRRGYAVVTLHRPSNVDDPAQLAGLMTVLNRLAERIPVVFPMHPRTQSRLAAAGRVAPALTLTPPLGYLDFVRLMSEARLALTDSGGIQEETTILQIPCLTLRENTERPITIEQGTNRLVGLDPKRILEAAWDALDNPPGPGKIPDLWDGRASARILDALALAVPRAAAAAC